MRTLPILGLLAVLMVLGGDADAASYQDLGVREKEVLDEALVLRGLTIDPQPEGKVIGAVHVVNLDVFTDRDLSFTLLDYRLSMTMFNRFHWTTREQILRREALFRPGDVYNQALIDETTRYLANPLYTSAIAILPVKGATPGTVDVLIATRDLWSLRLNTNFEYQAGKLLSLTASLAENNLFGHRKYLALVGDLNLGRFAIGPSYFDSNIRGTRLTASVNLRLLFARDTNKYEGSTASLSFGYPLFSLATPWGFGVDLSYSNGLVRFFQGNNLYQVPLTADDGTMVGQGYIYRLRTMGTGESIMRRFYAHGVLHDITLTQRWSLTRPSLLPDFPSDPTLQQQFEATVFPRTIGYVSSLAASYVVSAPRYRTYRDLNSFDLREPVTLGPVASFSVARADRLLGSDYQYWSMGATAGWSAALADGYQSVAVGWSVRLHDGGWSDELLSAVASAATPVIRRALRMVAYASTSLLFDDQRNALTSVGGDSGLRGYAIGEFIGKSTIQGSVEARSMAVPLPLLSLRLGALLFYDFGDAAVPRSTQPSTDNIFARTVNAFSGFHYYHDVGVGLRLLIPQANTDLLRIDWAFPLETDNQPSPVRTRAGWPGRFSAGFRQVF